LAQATNPWSWTMTTDHDETPYSGGRYRRVSQLTRICVLAATLVIATSATTTAWSEEMTVKIDNFTFSPQRLTVKAGTTITWVNSDDIPHTVVSTTKQFKSAALDTGDRFTFTFTTPGSYDYFCSLHPHMTGTVVVEEAKDGAGSP
jgi:plastocyanin